MSMRFLVVLSVLSGFHFGSKFGRHSFSVNLFISKVFFPSKSCIFVFTITTTLARDSRQQYPFMYKCNSTLNTLSSIANQTVGLALRFYVIIDWVLGPDTKLFSKIGCYNVHFHYSFCRKKGKQFTLTTLNRIDFAKRALIGPYPFLAGPHPFSRPSHFDAYGPNAELLFSWLFSFQRCFAVYGHEM